jgi:hypothetical protein
MKKARCPRCEKILVCEWDSQRGWEIPWHEDPNTGLTCDGVGTVQGQAHSGAFVDEYGSPSD